MAKVTKNSVPQTSTRELSELEKDYLAEQYVKPGFDIATTLQKMPGVSRQVLENFLSTIVPAAKENESAIERAVKLAQVARPAGDYMLKETQSGKSLGIVMMTETASELGDAHRTLNVPSTDVAARKQSDRIHVIDPNKKCR